MSHEYTNLHATSELNFTLPLYFSYRKQLCVTRNNLYYCDLSEEL